MGGAGPPQCAGTQRKGKPPPHLPPSDRPVVRALLGQPSCQASVPYAPRLLLEGQGSLPDPTRVLSLLFSRPTSREGISFSQEHVPTSLGSCLSNMCPSRLLHAVQRCPQRGDSGWREVSGFALPVVLLQLWLWVAWLTPAMPLFNVL